MRLQVGERLPGSGLPHQPGGYVVSQVVCETPWSGLYLGKKVFYSFDFTHKRPRENDEKEWLDVFLRTVHYPHLDDPVYVARRRSLARAEVRSVLGRGSGSLWPEPVDLLGVVNTRDPFGFDLQALGRLEASGQGLTRVDEHRLEPIAVFARPQGQQLATWRQGNPEPAAVLGLLAELLEFLAGVHDGSVLLNGLSAASVLVDGAGRAHYLGGDMAVEAPGTDFDWGLFFPPQRYPQGFAAPECFDPSSPRDRRADLYAWGSLAYFLLTGANPAQAALEQGQPWARFDDGHLGLLERALRSAPPAVVRGAAEQLAVDAEALLRDWPRNFLNAFRRCVAPDPGQRPGSVAELRAWMPAPPVPAGRPASAERTPPPPQEELPPGESLRRLWDRVFLAGDAEAHEQIVALLEPGPGAGESREGEYEAALQAELRRRADGRKGLGPQELPRLVRCLRQSPAARRHFAGLLRAADPRVREVGRELLLPDLGGSLAAGTVDAADVRRHLDRLCPPELLEEKTLLCQRLPYLDVDPAVVKQCLEQLQGERVVACDVCGEQLRAGLMEKHLRRSHQVYQFREARRSRQDTVEFLVDAVCGTSPDYAAWAALETIAQEEHGDEADGLLASWLARKLSAVPGPQRVARAGAAAEAIVAGGSGPRLAARCAGAIEDDRGHAASWHLALALAARLPPPVPEAMLRLVRPLLARKEVPRVTRQAATAALLRTTGKSGPAAEKLLRAYVGRAGKVPSIQRLQRLEEFVGQAPAIDKLVAGLEDQVRMRCPRCLIELRRAQMGTHLWDEHRLVLEGRRVRDPWHQIEDWLEDYRLERDAAVLERCRELAAGVDSEHGRSRLQLLLLRHGLEDPEALRAVLERARQERASVCPACYALVPAREPVAPAAVSLDNGGLHGAGFAVKLSEGTLLTTLRILTPTGQLYFGTEPGRRWSSSGTALVGLGLAALTLTPALVYAFATETGAQLLLSSLLVLGELLVVAGLIYAYWPGRRQLQDREVTWAWGVLVPHLLETGWTRKASPFVAGLARVSAGRGFRSTRAEPLQELCEDLESSGQQDRGLARVLGALTHLYVVDRADRGEDLVTLLAGQVQQSFVGKRSLAFADELLAPWETDGWTPANRRRLRLCLCALAFEAGLEVSDLVSLGGTYPNLGAALAVKDLDALAQLRLLWSLRLTRPWQRWGEAVTAFELAEAPEEGRTWVPKIPKLLLAVRDQVPICVGAGGVHFEGFCIAAPPRTIEVIARKPTEGGGYDLVVGGISIHFDHDPTDLAARLEKWCRYYYHDFLPQAAYLSTRPASAALKKLGPANGVECPECGHLLLPRAGERGMRLEF